MPKILIFDENAGAVKRTLRQAGFGVTTAANLSQALSVLTKSNGFDCMLMRYECGGDDAIQAVHEKHPELCLVVTTDQDRETVDKAMRDDWSVWSVVSTKAAQEILVEKINEAIDYATMSPDVKRSIESALAEEAEALRSVCDRIAAEPAI
jgi:DNA-binding NtrC family response regulator